MPKPAISRKEKLKAKQASTEVISKKKKVVPTVDERNYDDDIDVVDEDENGENGGDNEEVKETAFAKSHQTEK